MKLLLFACNVHLQRTGGAAIQKAVDLAAAEPARKRAEQGVQARAMMHIAGQQEIKGRAVVEPNLLHREGKKSGLK